MAPYLGTALRTRPTKGKINQKLGLMADSDGMTYPWEAGFGSSRSWVSLLGKGSSEKFSTPKPRNWEEGKLGLQA